MPWPPTSGCGNPNVRLVGLTATPYRMTTGMICGPENLLNEVCYETSVRELIVQGYLCPLKTKAGRRKVDTTGLHIRGGEFIAGEVEALMDSGALVRDACAEIVDHTRDRHSVLIFAAGVAHARHVRRVLGELGQECGFVCGETPAAERAETLARFREGALKYLVNVNVLTTGFDAPNIDCVAMLRPTNSPGLYYQMVGRSFRLHPDKTDSLVLDFGGNILRHGPVDALQIKKTMRVDYRVGLSEWQSEWVCFEHTGYARAKAEAWWRERSREPVPETAAEAVAIAEAGGVADALAITIRSVAGEKYDRIVGYRLAARPQRLDSTDERETQDMPDYVFAEDDLPF